MQPHPAFFRDFAYVFLAATIGGIVAWRLRQPLIIGYVLAGAVISPFTPGPKVHDVETLELFAEIGVVLLMFTVGMEFSLKDLLRAKWVAIFGGPTGIALSILMGIGAARWLGFNAGQGFIIGSSIGVASTMVMTRLLTDRGELRTEPGLVMVSITLVEDLAIVVLVVLIPSIGTVQANRLMSIGRGLAEAALVLVPAFFIAAKVIPRVLAHVRRTNSRELFFVVVLAVCLGTSAMTQAAGLSLALGAFVAGVIIGGSEFAIVSTDEGAAPFLSTDERYRSTNCPSAGSVLRRTSRPSLDGTNPTTVEATVGSSMSIAAERNFGRRMRPTIPHRLFRQPATLWWRLLRINRIIRKPPRNAIRICQVRFAYCPGRAMFWRPFPRWRDR